ncbi:DeoR/GlpR family DNA-binding transcription regulator [Consotaella aegiceratis]|uniref:DeoR/GlpR family DNA-binding transcription regulator n=1 Tax=Consotaella aegiceratis TaxID=3097961 RepID=UPI002F42F858
MHERERHRIILSSLQGRPFAGVGELVELTGASEATVRRDIATLALEKKLKRVRGGVEALNVSPYGAIVGRSFQATEAIRLRQKREIARAAAALCQDGEAVIINGGTTTYQMVHHLVTRQLQVMTNSFLIAEHLIKQSKCAVLVPAGHVYREQSLILSPFEADGIAHFGARRMFMGAQSVSALGIGETDALIVQSEQRLMRQAEELVLLVDSSKFKARSTMIVAPLERADVLVTDDEISDAAASFIEAAGVTLVVAERQKAEKEAGAA